MHAKQERVDRLIYFNDTLFETPIYCFCNQTSLYRSGACFDAILFSYSQSNASIGWGSTREPCK